MVKNNHGAWNSQSEGLISAYGIGSRSILSWLRCQMVPITTRVEKNINLLWKMSRAKKIDAWSVWPDIEKNCSPIVSKICPKGWSIRFYLKSTIFQISTKVTEYLGYFCKNFCPIAFKSSPILSHCFYWVFSIKFRWRWTSSSATNHTYDQWDQMTRLFFQFLAIWNNEILLVT